MLGMLLDSWGIYERYTAPLGVGWMVTPHYHYGPDIDGYEYSRWGTYHFADRDGIGVDRTVATGTGYTAQYEPVLAKLYEDIASCPDELLLFFHHVPYGRRSGVTSSTPTSPASPASPTRRAARSTDRPGGRRGAWQPVPIAGKSSGSLIKLVNRGA